MGLKSCIDTISLSSACGWNQTKMGLKFHIFRGEEEIWVCVEIRPRWDWNLDNSEHTQTQPKQLKSDQDGIEITRVILKFPLQRNWLKSDQDGIEISCCHRNYLNWAVMLKSDQDGIEILHTLTLNLFSKCVEIRPRWDWNSFTRTPRLRPPPVEIRPRWDWNTYGKDFATQMCRVEIRPRWDWNVFYMGTSFGMILLKSDQDGIEI